MVAQDTMRTVLEWFYPFRAFVNINTLGKPVSWSVIPYTCPTLSELQSINSTIAMINCYCLETQLGEKAVQSNFIQLRPKSRKIDIPTRLHCHHSTLNPRILQFSEHPWYTNGQDFLDILQQVKVKFLVLRKIFKSVVYVHRMLS